MCRGDHALLFVCLFCYLVLFNFLLAVVRGNIFALLGKVLTLYPQQDVQKYALPLGIIASRHLTRQTDSAIVAGILKALESFPFESTFTCLS